MARSLQWRIYYHRMWGQLSTTFSNLLKEPNGELLVAVSHNQLQIMASETVDPIDWSHPTQSVDENVNVEVSSAASVGTNTNANIKFVRIIRRCGCEYSLDLYFIPNHTIICIKQDQSSVTVATKSYHSHF